MNIYDVSERAGVSIATVSRVLNGNSNVSEKTRQKVLTVIKEIGYTPNIFARGLGLNTMQTIGIMCSDSSDIFLSNAVYFLEQNLRKNGYDSFLCCTGNELQNKKNYLKLLLSKRVDAVILVGSSFLETNHKDNNYIFEAASKVPIMMINGYLNHPNIYCTLCDDRQAIYDSTCKLITEKRNRILFLYHSKSYSSLQKLNGYKDAIIFHKLFLQEDLILQCPHNIQEIQNFLNKHFENGLRFDAVIAAEDLLAVGTLKFLKSKGIVVPKMVNIIGYNNSLLADCCEPELSSIDNRVEILSLTTVTSLMGVLTGITVPNKTTISNDLILRGTTDFVQ